MRILLDTCTFLWIIAADQRLSGAALDAFRDPDNDVHLSSVSGWEISVKNALGRLPLPEPPERYVPAQRTAHGISPLALLEEATLREGKLPNVHRDPFDRMLVCQAIEHDMVLLTPDTDIAAYPIKTLW